MEGRKSDASLGFPDLNLLPQCNTEVYEEEASLVMVQFIERAFSCLSPVCNSTAL